MKGSITASESLAESPYGPLVIVETVDDLRLVARAEPFWRKCEDLCEGASHAVQLRLHPKSACGMGVRMSELRRLWKLSQSIIQNGYWPNFGDEIMLQAETWYPWNGTHRAAILVALDRSVPALIVSGWEDDRDYVVNDRCHTRKRRYPKRWLNQRPEQ